MNKNRYDYSDKIRTTDRVVENDRVNLIGRINHGEVIHSIIGASTSRKGLIENEQAHSEYFLMSEDLLFDTIGSPQILEKITGENPKDLQVKRNFMLRSAIVCFLHANLQDRVCNGVEREKDLRVPIVYKGNLSQLKTDFNAYLEERINENRYS